MFDLFVVVVYFSVMLYLGWKSRSQSADSYWIGDRKYGTGRITSSLVATIFGASSTMGIIGLGYSRGLTGAWWSLIGGIALIPFALFLAGRVRRLQVYTLPDILRRAYGDRVAVPAGIMISVAWCGVVAAQLIAGGRLLAGFLSLDFQFTLPVVAFVFTLYTFWGGQISVIKTDFWQFLLFMGGLLISLAFLLAGFSAQPQLWSHIPSGHLAFPVSSGFGWYDVAVFYPLIVGLPYLVGPDIYSRTLCARDDGVARRSAMRAAMIIVPLSFLLAVFGVLASSMFPGIPAEAALPEVLNRVIPMGLRGLILAGFLAAIMSSADTCLLSASTILTLNVLRPFHRGTSDSHLRITRVAVLIMGLVAWLIASQQQGIISSLLLGYTVFVGGVVFPTLAALFRKRLRVTPWGALWAVIVGGGSAILGKIHGGAAMKAVVTQGGQDFLEMVLGFHYLSILPIILCLVVMIGVSRVTQPLVQEGLSQGLPSRPTSE